MSPTPFRWPLPGGSSPQEVKVELSARRRVCRRMRPAKPPARNDTVFLSCRRAQSVPAIPGRPSSSLPSSFVRGRGAAVFSLRLPPAGRAARSTLRTEASR